MSSGHRGSQNVFCQHSTEEDLKVLIFVEDDKGLKYAEVS